jgi:drug/metabolite transporter (DMT)-like permease
MNARFQAIHFIVDYAVGILLLVGPWLFGFTESFTAIGVTIVFGAALIANAVCAADRRLSQRFPFSTHLLLEVAGGGLLIGTPWICGFSAYAWVPHVVIGIVVAVRGLLLLLGTAVIGMFSDKSGGLGSRS